MDKSTVKLTPDPKQLRDLYAVFKTMDKESGAQLRNDVQKISQSAAEEIKQAAYGAMYGKQAERVAKSVKANRDRIPNVTIGGSRFKFSGGVPSGTVLFGNEFGAGNGFPNGGRRFPFPRKQGNWIFPTLRRIQPTVTHQWKQAVDKILRNW